MSAANASAKKRRTNPVNIQNGAFVPTSTTIEPPRTPPISPSLPPQNQVLPLQQIIYLFDKRLAVLENKIQEQSVVSSGEPSVKNENNSSNVNLPSQATANGYSPQLRSGESQYYMNTEIENRLRRLEDEITDMKIHKKPVAMDEESIMVTKADFLQLQDMVLKLHSHFIDLNHIWLQQDWAVINRLKKNEVVNTDNILSANLADVSNNVLLSAESTDVSNNVLSADSTDVSNNVLSADSTDVSNNVLTADSTEVSNNVLLSADSTEVSNNVLTADSTEVSNNVLLSAESTEVSNNVLLSAESTEVSNNVFSATKAVDVSNNVLSAVPASTLYISRNKSNTIKK
jgi:hypothetical protein